MHSRCGSRIQSRESQNTRKAHVLPDHHDHLLIVGIDEFVAVDMTFAFPSLDEGIGLCNFGMA